MKKDKRKMPAPRNPYVVAAKVKTGAGAHRKTEKVKRRDAKMELRRGVAQGQSSGLLIRRREFDPLHLDQQQTTLRISL